MSRLGNGTGSVYKLSGKNRKHPWTARKTEGFDERGYPIYKYIGYYRTKADAMAALSEYNKSPYSLEGETVKGMYEKFLVYYKENRAERSVQSLEYHWKHLEPLYDLKISEITRKDLQIFFDNLEKSEVTKEKCKSVLKLVFDYSIRYDVIPPDRISIFKYIDLSSKVEVDRHPHERITAEEIEWLYEKNDDISKFLLFLIFTGLRCGEYCDMTDESIDDDYVIHIDKSKTKAGLRDVPLSEKAKKLAPIPHFSSYSTMKSKFVLWKRKNKFNHQLHDTRHTCVSLLTEAGVDERIIRSIVGHKGKGITEEVYTHITIEEKRVALNKI